MDFFNLCLIIGGMMGWLAELLKSLLRSVLISGACRGLA